MCMCNPKHVYHGHSAEQVQPLVPHDLLIDNLKCSEIVQMEFDPQELWKGKTDKGNDVLAGGVMTYDTSDPSQPFYREEHYPSLWDEKKAHFCDCGEKGSGEELPLPVTTNIKKNTCKRAKIFGHAMLTLTLGLVYYTWNRFA